MADEKDGQPELGEIRPISELPDRRRDHFDWEGFFEQIPPGHFAEVEGVNKYTLRRKAERFGGGKVKVVIRRDAEGKRHLYLARKE